MPINDERNNALAEEYRHLADARKDVIFGARLGAYRYYEMDQVIEAALNMVRQELKRSELIAVSDSHNS